MILQNPFADPLFQLAAARLLGLFGLTLAAILWLQRRRLGGLLADPVFIKWRTWAVIAPIYLAALFSGPLVLVAFVLAISLQGLREYAALTGLSPRYRSVLLAMGAVAAPVAGLSLDGYYLLAPVLLLVAVAQPLAFHDEAEGVRHLAFAALGWGYIAWLLGHLVLIGRHLDGGTGILLVLGIAVALSDIGAFACGKTFGRRKLAPRLSPNKTWAGAIGNLVGAYAGVGLMAFALPEAGRWVVVLCLPPIIAVGALWGDLFESAIKREAGVKDAGAWLPGFGGILDRIDSLVLVAPLSYYFLRLIG